MRSTTRLLGMLVIVGSVSATEVLAGKPAPPPPPPDPAIVVMGMAVRTSANLFVMNADGSNLRLLLAAADSKSLGGSNHRQPSWSPDGAWVFFASDMPVRPDANPELEGTGPGIYRIHRSGSPLCKIAELNGKLGSNVPHEAPVVQFGWNGSKIVYVDQVYDRPCSEGLCEQLDVFLVDATCGAPAPVNLTRSPSFNESGPTWSPDALRIAVAVSDSAGAPGAWVSVCDLNGEAFGPCETLDFPGPGGPSGLDWSRQGDRLAVHNYVGSGDDLWVYSFVDASWIRLTTTPLQEAWPTWSPDDGRIAFCRRDSQNLNLYVMEAVPGATIRDLAKPKPGTTRYWMPDWRRY